MLKLAVCDDEKVFRSDLKRILGMELDLCGSIIISLNLPAGRS